MFVRLLPYAPVHPTGSGLTSKGKSHFTKYSTIVKCKNKFARERERERGWLAISLGIDSFFRVLTGKRRFLHQIVVGHSYGQHARFFALSPA